MTGGIIINLKTVTKLFIYYLISYFSYLFSNCSSRETNYSSEPLSSLTVRPECPLPGVCWWSGLMLLSGQLHWISAQLPPRVSCQHGLPDHSSLHHREVPRPLPWLVWSQCWLPSSEPHTDLLLCSQFCGRSFYSVLSGSRWVEKSRH